MGAPPDHPSHEWPWLSTETYGDLGIPHDFLETSHITIIIINHDSALLNMDWRLTID